MSERRGCTCKKCWPSFHDALTRRGARWSECMHEDLMLSGPTQRVQSSAHECTRTRASFTDIFLRPVGDAGAASAADWRRKGALKRTSTPPGSWTLWESEKERNRDKVGVSERQRGSGPAYVTDLCVCCVRSGVTARLRQRVNVCTPCATPGRP